LKALLKPYDDNQTSDLDENGIIGVKKNKMPFTRER
jgi:hypothetical protein